MVSGRNPDTERLRRIAELRAQGMLLKEIGERFGISKQAVKFALERACREGRSARCSGCRVRIESPVASGLYRDLLCLDCLERHPETPFYQMLKSLRVAAGWTQEELAKQAGLERTQISYLERGRQLPKWPMAVGLLRVLGARLAIRPRDPTTTGRAV